MKSTGRLVALCAAFLLQGMALEAQGPSILDFPFEHEGAPCWISAEAVADAEKIINLDLVNNYALRIRVEKQLRTLADRPAAEKLEEGQNTTIAPILLSDCRSTMISISCREDPKPNSTLFDLATNSQSIIRGKIRTVDLGFGFGMPSSLLGVEVSEVIKGPARHFLFYIHYPIAHFRIGPLHFCNGNQGYEPQSGDEVLLFDYMGTRDRDDVLYVPQFQELFFQNNGALILPPKLEGTPGLEAVRTLDEVVRRIKTGNFR